MDVFNRTTALVGASWYCGGVVAVAVVGVVGGDDITTYSTPATSIDIPSKDSRRSSFGTFNRIVPRMVSVSPAFFLFLFLLLLVNVVGAFSSKWHEIVGVDVWLPIFVILYRC